MKESPHMIHHPLLLLCELICVAGCASSEPVGQYHDGSDLRITLLAKSLGRRYTYFKLEKDDQLLFGGGRDAVQHIARPVTVLTPAQKEQIWQIINEHHLLVDRHIERQEPQRVSYQAKLAEGERRWSFRCVDDQVPGVKALHDKLFQFQAQIRYPGSTTP